MKKLKNGQHFINIDCKENFQITGPLKVWVLVFQGSTFKPFVHGHLCMVNFPHLENWKYKFSVDSFF